MQTAPGIRWWLADEAWVPWAEEMTAVIRSFRPSADCTALRGGRGGPRLVVRTPRPASAGVGPESAIFKAFRLRRIGYALFGASRGFARAEVTNLFMASDRGLPVPRAYGYCERRICGVWVAATGLLMEDFRDTETVSAVLRDRGTPENVAWAMSAASELIVALYRAGCNHIDIHGDNMILPREGGAGNKIIDLTSARFHEHPSPDLLRFMVAYFAGSIARYIDAAFLEQWIEGILVDCGAGSSLGSWGELVTRTRRKRPSRRERFAVE